MRNGKLLPVIVGVCLGTLLSEGALSLHSLYNLKERVAALESKVDILLAVYERRPLTMGATNACKCPKCDARGCAGLVNAEFCDHR